MFNTLPFHSSSAAYSHSSSSVPPFAAGIHEPPLCTFSGMIVAHKSEYKHHKWVQCHHYCNVLYSLSSSVRVFAQTLVAHWDSCSLKLCSNCSLLCASTCFSWNQILTSRVRSVINLIYVLYSIRHLHLCELVYWVLQQNSCSFSLISLFLKCAEHLLCLQHLRMSLFHSQLQLHRRNNSYIPQVKTVLALASSFALTYWREIIFNLLFKDNRQQEKWEEFRRFHQFYSVLLLCELLRLRFVHLLQRLLVFSLLFGQQRLIMLDSVVLLLWYKSRKKGICRQCKELFVLEESSKQKRHSIFCGR